MEINHSKFSNSSQQAFEVPTVLGVWFSVSNAILYDSYTGAQITREELRRHDKANTTFWCVKDVPPCDPEEGRRVDGSCNNLNNPVRGTAHTPFARVLPPDFGPNFTIKKSSSGNDLPNARYLRTRLISVGKVPSQRFTMLALHYFVFMAADVVSLHDTVNYIIWKTYCCEERGKTDPVCIPITIPADDPVHRFSGHRCLNMTRPETFQSVGCVKSTALPPERIVSSTPLMDLSAMYGNFLLPLLQRGRSYSGGLLNFEIEDGRIWPPSTKTQANICYLNQPPRETRCHRMPEDGGNTLAGINMVAIWFWRHHNLIANELAEVNPCWDDDKLFETARDINIAISLQLYYYELLPLFFGYENMVQDNVIVPTIGFRDEYQEDIMPQVSLEYPFVLRWVHNVQEGSLKLYDPEGYYLREFPIVNLTVRTGFLAVDNNIDYMTQGSFRQGSAHVDYIADPDITELGLGGLQELTDIVTNDLAKTRYLGFPPFVNYREACFGKPVRTFEDLRGIVDDERIEILKEVYEKVEDIDMLAGIWAEKFMPGSFVPPTFYCIVVEQLKRNIYSDRHWYERPNRPKAFTIDQLSEIRKITIARLVCDVGDTVTEIQPKAFLRAGLHNQINSCDYIPKIDFSAWRDDRCACGDHIIWSKYPSL